ncbi:MAG: P-loop containing nucleoside triphosphate hydrolase protein [Benniella sp.]|nr:MAG: P-loop containing nucleoside triphosphate hydrolase protein [Benniella sp.]
MRIAALMRDHTTHRVQNASRCQVPRLSQTPGVARLYSANTALAQEESVVASAKTIRRGTTTKGSKATISSETTTATPKTRQRRSKSTAKTTSEAADGTPVVTIKKPKSDKSISKPTRARKTKATVSNIDSSTTSAPADPTQLRPYQQECIDTCLDNLVVKGIKRQIVSLPVGSGKTVIFSHLMKKVQPPFPGATKVLVLAHRQELLEQTRNHVLRTGTGLTATIDQGSRKADMSADVIIASVPSLGRAGTRRLLKYDPKQFKCIIIDEAHHAAADSYRRILEHFGAHVPDTHIFVYGCSATVRRHDGLKLGNVFDHISYHKSFVNMIEEEWLCGLRVSTIKTEFDLRDVKMQAGDFSQKDLSVKVNTPIRNDIVVRSYMTYCKDRKSTVVFAVDIAHLETLTEVFRKYGYDARGISSLTGDGERAKLLREFREQKFPIIVNCGILTEGTDIPSIDSVIMARPTKSNVLFLQMLGRGMRLHPGKKDCLVLDFVDIVRGDRLVSLPTLLGLDPSSVMDRLATINSQEDINSILKDEIETIEQAPNLAQYPEETETDETIDPMTGAKIARIRVLEYENPYQLLGDCSGMPRGVWNMSPNAWVNVGPDIFVLTVKEVTFRIEKSPDDGLYRCLKRIKLPKGNVAEASIRSSKNGVLTFQNNYAARAAERKKQMEEGADHDEGYFQSKGTTLPIESDTLQDCLHGVDTWIAKKIGHFPELIGRHAKWRSFPASDSQLRFLKQLGYDPMDHDTEGDGSGRRLDPKFLTKGQAANMITRLVNGAGKWWKQSRKFRVMQAKKMAKEIGVDVGPIPKTMDI